MAASGSEFLVSENRFLVTGSFHVIYFIIEIIYVFLGSLLLICHIRDGWRRC